MNKFKILPAFFLLVSATTLAAYGQTDIAAANADSAAATLKFKREFSLPAEAKNGRANRRRLDSGKNFSGTANAPANSARRRQTTYARPSKEARFKRYVSDAFGVPALIGATFGATFGQIGNDPPEWERTVGGFGRRFASRYATNAIRNSISYGLSETFKLDNRFEKSGQKNFGKRLKHVFLGSYTTRTRDGKRIPDFPHFVGTYSASVIANEAWHPDRFGYKDGLRDGTVSLGIRFGVNLLREFVFPK